MTPSTAQIHEAAGLLLARRRDDSPGPRLPEHCRPADLESAWAVQQQVSAGLGQAIGGWKASVPSPGKLVAAPIYAPTVSNAARVPVTTKDAKVEPEFAFVLGRDLPPRGTPYTPAEIDAAIAAVHAALEICASRYLDHTGLPFPEMLADGLVNSGLWLGPKLEQQEAASYELRWQSGDKTAQTLPAAHGDGNPRLPLYWLVNFLGERGITLKAGQAVITGSYAGVLILPLNQPVAFSYGDIASFTVEFQTT